MMARVAAERRADFVIGLGPADGRRQTADGRRKTGRRFRASLALGLALGTWSLQGCAGGASDGKGGEGASASSATVGSESASAAAQPASPPGACRLEGDWQLCSVEDRLVHAGLIITRRPEPPEVPFFHTKGTTFGIGDGDDEIDVFIYPTTEARARDTDALDSATASPPGTRYRWNGTPTLVTSNNLAAVIRSERQRQVERLALALGAGLPTNR